MNPGCSTVAPPRTHGSTSLAVGTTVDWTNWKRSTAGSSPARLPAMSTTGHLIDPN